MRHHALFCVDPGGSTGLSWAVVDLQTDTVAEAMRRREARGSATVTGNEFQQIDRIVNRYDEFVGQLQGEPLDLIIEDWNPLGKRTKEGSSPARIAWGLLGYLYGRGMGDGVSIVWVQPDAQRFSTQARLRPCDAWVVGRDHERASYALMIARLHKLMGS